MTRFVCCGYRKRYVNPYDRADSVQQAEELKRVNEDNNLSLTSRLAYNCVFVLHNCLAPMLRSAFTPSYLCISVVYKGGAGIVIIHVCVCVCVSAYEIT